MVFGVKVRLDVPDAPGEWIEIRHLGWRVIREAREASMAEAMRLVKTLGREGLEAVKAVTPDQIAAVRPNGHRPHSEYDLGIILSAAVTSWSYAPPVTREALEDLPEALATWIRSEVLARSLPDEATSKNG